LRDPLSLLKTSPQRPSEGTDVEDESSDDVSPSA
jgi:hypothetical protein